MTDQDLLGVIEHEEKRALGYLGGDLSAERAKALDYYHGLLPDVPKIDGRSDVVSTDVRDAVDGMLPDLLEIFLSTDDVVKYEPHGPEDEAQADQATDVINHVFYRQNPGALILYEWQKTALLEKNSFVKYWWDESQQITKESYQGLNDLDMQMLTADPNVQIKAHTGYDSPLGALHDVQVVVTNKQGKCCVRGVPPENMLVSLSHDSLCLADTPFIGERGKKTASDLKELGIDPDDVQQGGDDDTWRSQEWNARRRLSDERLEPSRDSPAQDPSLREFTYLDCKVLTDWDGDGIAELRRVLRVGNTIVLNEDCDDIGYAALCPDILPYRFYGLSVSDLVMDIQKLKSVIWRQMLDSLYLSNNPRIGVMESMVNLDDLLVSRPGGVVRFKTNPSLAWAPMEHRFVGQQAFPMVEYMDAVKENRTGFTRYNQGSDAGSLNKTATGISIITASASKRMRMIARMFAETGMKDLFKGLLHLMAKYNTKPMTMRLRNQWVPVDPRQWSTQWDMSINVGLGVNDRQSQLQHLQTVMATQQAVRGAGMSHIVNDQNIYRAAKRLAENAGFKQDGEFFTAPSQENPPPQPPPAPEVMRLEMDAKMKAAELHAEDKRKAMEVQNAQSIAQVQAQTTIAVAQIKAETDRAKAQHDAMMAERQMQHDGEMQRSANAHGAEVEIFKAGGAAPGDRARKEEEMQHQAIMQLMQALQQIATMNQQIMQVLAADREIVLDKQGNPIGSRVVVQPPKALQ